MTSLVRVKFRDQWSQVQILCNTNFKFPVIDFIKEKEKEKTPLHISLIILESYAMHNATNKSCNNAFCLYR